MPDNYIDYFAYIVAAASAVKLVSDAGKVRAYLHKSLRENACRRWTGRQEAQLRAGGRGFKLQVLLSDRASLEWAMDQGRLRVAKRMPWGWYVVLETRLLPNRSLPKSE